MSRPTNDVNTLRTSRTRPLRRQKGTGKQAEASRKLGPYPALGPARYPAQPAESDWEIVICGDLAEKQYELLERLASVPRRSRGTIWFDSCGGSAYVGLALASMIRLRGLDATAVVAGECSSAAIMPFAACQHRFVSKHATLLFHPVRWHSEENVRQEEAVEWVRHFQILEQELDQLLCELLPISREALDAWTHPGRFVSGDEVIAAGLAHRLDLFAGDIWSQARDARTSKS